MHELEPEKVEKTEALAALDKILASEEFAASPQLASFLTFSVRRTLDGQGPALKAYTIATEVLSRPHPLTRKMIRLFGWKPLG